MTEEKEIELREILINLKLFLEEIRKAPHSFWSDEKNWRLFDATWKSIFAIQEALAKAQWAEKDRLLKEQILKECLPF